MSLDHEPRQAIETTTNPNRSNRKRNRIIAGVAGGTALLAAIGAGVGLSGGSDTEAQPNQPVATGKATPGGENSPSAEPTAKATEAQPAGVEYVFDSQTVQVPRVEVGSLESDNARQDYYDTWYNSIDADRLEAVALKNRPLANEDAAQNDDVKFMLMEPMTNPNASNSYTKADYLDDLNADIAATSEVLSQPRQFPDKHYTEAYDKYAPDMSDPEFHLTQADFNSLMKRAEQGDASAQTDLYKHLVGWSQNYATLSQTAMLTQLADRVKQGLNDGSAEDQNTVAGIINQEKAMASFGLTGDMKQWAEDNNEQFLYEGYPDNNLKSLAATYASKNVEADDILEFFNYLPSLVEKKDILKGTTAKVLNVKSINVSDESNYGDNSKGEQTEDSACQIIFEVTDELGSRKVVKVKTGPAPLKSAQTDKSVVGWIAETEGLSN